jgi:His/Glu/Gln/Arg/opine family amino acid ABC transporter permease subunit
MDSRSPSSLWPSWSVVLLDYDFDWSMISDHWTALLAGAWLDVRVAFAGFALACALGLALTLAMATFGPFAFPGFLYTQVVRGLPPYVLLLWLYFGLAQATGIILTAVQATVAMIAISGSGYTSEVFRSGARAVESGQREAARSLGFGRWHTFADVVLPQTLRVVVPPLGNIFVGHLKVATIMSLIAATDMVYVAQDINYTYFRPFEGYTAVAAILVALVFLFSGIVRLIERRLRLP